MWDIPQAMYIPTPTGVVFIMEPGIITGPGMEPITIPGRLPMAIVFTGIPIQDGDFHLGHLMDG